MVYEISELTRVFDNRTVLDISSLEIEKGRIYALLGPNGAGKTTLLNILGFLDPPTAGKILYCARPVHFTEAYLHNLRKTVVVVDQQPILFTTTVYKNLEFGLKIRKIPYKRRKHIIEEALDLVGMRDFAEARAHKLSGGETQRVAIARAIAVLPEVLLCDEPTSSVDVENQTVIMNILRQINTEKKITVLFTTHDRTQAASLTGNTLFLDHGRLAGSDHENIFAAVLSEIENNSIRCFIQDTVRLTLPFERIGKKTGKVRIMIQPEMISLSNIKDPPNNGHLKGKVVQVTDENENVRIVVDLGIRITLLMSKHVYRKNRPLVGEHVGVLIPPESIYIL